MKLYLPFLKICIKNGYMAIKFDMEKAYDRLDWDFLIKCFTDLDFSGKWTN